MQVFRKDFFSNNMIIKGIKLLITAIIFVFLLHVPQCRITTIGKVADKYDLRINRIEYYRDEVLIEELEVLPEESIQLLEWMKNIKIYQPLFSGFYRETEDHQRNFIRLSYNGRQNIFGKEMFGTFSLSEAGGLNVVKYSFYPFSEKHPEIYEYLMKMLEDA